MTKQSFKTNVLLKSIIGKDLINNDNIAVLELAKNSFDAGSRKVEITFKNIFRNDDAKNLMFSHAASRVIIQDWGAGMNESDITNRWLNIAYSDKKANATQHGRRMAGAKGIGRFSCDRLGRFLKIYTRKRGEEYFQVRIDWHDFEVEGQPDKRIESVSVDVVKMAENEIRKAGYAGFTHGTIVEISRLRSDWDESKLRSLRQYLERLLSPNQQFSQTPFVLNLSAVDFSKDVNGEIKSRVFDRLEFTSTSIESTISPDGKTIHTKLLDKGREIFDLVEKNERFDLLKGVKVVIYYLNQYGKAYFKKTTGQDKISYGSIFLFINGFRIPPYGDEKDDWLGLDRWKSQSYGKYLGTREVVGRIEIDDPDGSYKIVSSREGIVRDKKGEQLTERNGFYFLAQRRLESHVIDGLDWDKTPHDEAISITKEIEKRTHWRFNPKEEVYTVDRPQKDMQILKSLSSTLNVRPRDVLSLTLNTDIIDELQSQEREKVGEILSQFSQYGEKLTKTTGRSLEKVRHILEVQERQLVKSQKEKTQLEKVVHTLEVKAEQVGKENLFLRATLSTDSKEVMALQHQIGLSSKRIEFKLRELKIAIDAKADAKVVAEIINVLSLENKKIQSVSRFVTKANFSMETRWIEKDVVQFVREYIENVYQEYEEFRINNTQIVVKVDDGGVVWARKFTPLELIIVVDNLLDNARKAGAKKVDVQFKVEGRSGLAIAFRDDGKGIPKENLPRVFDFGFTTTTGSGLGLYHVKEIIERLGGTVVVESRPGQGASFTLQIPK